jgi:hypothetical protein
MGQVYANMSSLKNENLDYENLERLVNESVNLKDCAESS